MNYQILTTAQTNNFNDPAMQQKLASLWQDDPTAIQAAFKAGQTVACVYHDYETNYKGDYSVSLCVESHSSTDFDTSNYQWQKYEVDSKDELGVIKTWQKIWADEENAKIDRSYDFDFEQYSPNGKVAIYIAIQ